MRSPADEWAQRAATLMDLKRYGEAEAEARRALVADPASEQGLYHLARAVISQGRHKEGLALVDDYIAAHPDAEWGHRQRALVLRDLGRPRPALASALESVRLRPQLSEAHSVAADCYRISGSLAKAAEHADIARSLDPEGWAPVFAGARVAEAERRPGEAENLYRDVLRRDPGNAIAMNNLGRLLLRRGASTESQQLFEQAARTDVRLDVARRNLTLSARRQVRLAGPNDRLASLLQVFVFIAATRTLLGLVEGNLIESIVFTSLAALLGAAEFVTRRMRSRRLAPLFQQLLSDTGWTSRLRPARLRATAAAGTRNWRFQVFVLAALGISIPLVIVDHAVVTPLATGVISAGLIVYFCLCGLELVRAARSKLLRRGWWPNSR